MRMRRESYLGGKGWTWRVMRKGRARKRQFVTNNIIMQYVLDKET